MIVIVRMYDGLHGADLRMAEKGGERRTNYRFPGNVPILLGNFTTGALAPAGCDNHSRDLARHVCISARDSGIALAHVPQMCERRAQFPSGVPQRYPPDWSSALLILQCSTCARARNV
jgi:hypothetical protein